VVEEPIPYFSQLRCCPKPSGATKQSEQQDLSAARLEDIASEGHHPLPHPHIPPASQSHHSDKGTPTVQSKLDVEAQIGSIPSIQEEVPTDTTDLDAVIKQYVYSLILYHCCLYCVLCVCGMCVCVCVCLAEGNCMSCVTLIILNLSPYAYLYSCYCNEQLHGLN